MVSSKEAEIVELANTEQSLRRFVRNLRKKTNTELRACYPPNEEDEEVRDLCRAREQAKGSQTAAKHRLNKFLRQSSIHISSLWCYPPRRLA